MSQGQVRVRKDITKLTRPELDVLIKAFRAIQDKDPRQPDSYYHIAGLHGQPFRGAGYGNPAWWGGYCHHGNVLFPTWHRAYVASLEKALRSVEGCEDVAMPYWNQLEGSGIPFIFTQPKYTYSSGPEKDKEIANPLYSYKFQTGFFDLLGRKLKGQDVDYRKHKGYETVRFPYSGLVGPGDQDKTKKHNAEIEAKGLEEVNKLLNGRVNEWLQGFSNYNESILHTGARERYYQCLQAPNYTVFSNTTSAAKYNDDNLADVSEGELRHPDEPGYDPSKAPPLAVSIETPHNHLHLAIGGYDMADRPDHSGSNGDMGENDTAAFDPIFFFHHTFIDLVFWSWQSLKEQTEALTVEPYYPGTSPVDSQGPTPGISAGQWLNMDTPLEPFKKANGTDHLTSNDVANIIKLGYDYDKLVKPPKRRPQAAPVVRVAGIDRGQLAGSFVVSISADVDDKKILVGYEPVFSRWHVAGCANCRNSLSVPMHIPLVYYDTSGYNEPVSLVPNNGVTDGDGEEAPPFRFPPTNKVSPLPVESARILSYSINVVSKSASEEEKQDIISGAMQDLGKIAYLASYDQ
ncbi:hypothetical protein S40288_01843 [Stachybotrys chartarum IBT 40288]|nr:hypothetical protein S40288_01843 [Stachybotrys chartarum IBT 40288]